MNIIYVLYSLAALSCVLVAAWGVRWWRDRNRIRRITAVALGSGHLRDDLLSAGVISEDQHARGLNVYDFKMIRRNEKLVEQLRKEHPNLLAILRTRVFRYL